MQEINLYDLLRYYARNWLILLSALFIGAIIGLIYTNYLQTPLYKSDATMLVVGQRTSQDSTINNNYTELFKSRRVLETVIDQQGYDGNYEQLLVRTTATNDRDTDIIRVSIADPNPKKSEALLSSSLEVFRNEASELYESNNINVVDPANLPFEPYNVMVIMQIGLAMVAVFLITAIAMFFAYDYQLTEIKYSNNKATKKDSSSESMKAKNLPKKKSKVNSKSSYSLSPKSLILSLNRVRSINSLFFKKNAK